MFKFLWTGACTSLMSFDRYPYEEVRYNAVVEACALRPDFAVLEFGDATEIGSRCALLKPSDTPRLTCLKEV